LAVKYGKGGKDKREAIGQLMAEVQLALKSVTVTAPDYETLQLFQTARRLYKPGKKKLTVPQKLEITRRFAKAHEKFKDHPKVVEVTKKVVHYNTQLRNYGLTDRQVKRSNINVCGAIFLFFARLFRLIFLMLFALPGLILNLPAGIIINRKSRQKAEEAVRGSTVKIKGNDVLATWKLLTGMGVVPIFHLIYAIIIGVLVGVLTDLAIYWKIIIPIGSLILLPIISYWSVRFFEVSHDLYVSLIPLIWVIFCRGEDLRKTRKELQQDVRGLVEELGPKIFPNFSKDRIVKPDDDVAAYKSQLFSTDDMRDIIGSSPKDDKEEEIVISIQDKPQETDNS